LSNFYAKHVAYVQIMATRARKRLYGLADSPVDLAAFMLDGDGTGQPEEFAPASDHCANNGAAA